MMILQCQVVMLHITGKIVVKVSNSTSDFDSLTLPNDDNLKLGDRFQLVAQPCPPEQPEPEPTF